MWIIFISSFATLWTRHDVGCRGKELDKDLLAHIKDDNFRHFLEQLSVKVDQIFPIQINVHQLFEFNEPVHNDSALGKPFQLGFINYQ